MQQRKLGKKKTKVVINVLEDGDLSDGLKYAIKTIKILKQENKQMMIFTPKFNHLVVEIMERWQGDSHVMAEVINTPGDDEFSINFEKGDVVVFKPTKKIEVVVKGETIVMVDEDNILGIIKTGV